MAGFAVVATISLWGLGELPIDRINTGVASLQARVSRVVQFLGPVASPTAAPARQSTPQALAALPAKPTEDVAAQSERTEDEPSATPTPETTATASPTLEPTATETPTPTPTSTPEPTASPTAAPTATPTQPPAPSGPLTYKVQSGDTLSSIAAKYGISWQELATVNKLTSRSTLRSGQELVIPVPGSAAPAPGAGAVGTKYKVRSGDSLSSIATQFGITWQELADANGLTGRSRLSIGQELIIPGKGGVAQATPTAAPAPVATARPEPTAAVLLSAPQLANPADQASFRGASTEIYLTWQERDGIPSGAGYRVLIQWTEQGAPMEYLVPLTSATSIRMPSWLFEKADQPTRKYTWSVRVVRTTTDGRGGEKDVLLSPSSESRVLYWY